MISLPAQLRLIALVAIVATNSGGESLLVNGDFDSDLNGWRPWGATPTQWDAEKTRWSARDMGRSKSSGSLEVVLDRPGISRGRLQCLPARAGESLRLRWCRGRIGGRDEELLAGIHLMMFSDDDCQRVIGMSGATEYVWSGWRCGSQELTTWPGTRSLGVQLRGLRREGYGRAPASVSFDRIRLEHAATARLTDTGSPPEGVGRARDRERTPPPDRAAPP